MTYPCKAILRRRFTTLSGAQVFWTDSSIFQEFKHTELLIAMLYFINLRRLDGRVSVHDGVHAASITKGDVALGTGIMHVVDKVNDVAYMLSFTFG